MLYNIKSLDELGSFAKGLAKNLKGGDVVALSGELGAGKTTLIQMIGRELGVTIPILSPSFVIFKIYQTNSRKIKNLCHVDLYRLTETESLFGFEECLGDKDTLCLIEWAEKIKDKLPAQTIWLKIELRKDGVRTIKRTG